MTKCSNDDTLVIILVLIFYIIVSDYLLILVFLKEENPTFLFKIIFPSPIFLCFVHSHANILLRSKKDARFRLFIQHFIYLSDRPNPSRFYLLENQQRSRSGFIFKEYISCLHMFERIPFFVEKKKRGEKKERTKETIQN